ncbi:hypothetical protein GGF37_002187 [Kickxella alabastrina]|nr:hypothetical protein GGF37_002187 [Kickxella alabastrina]
MKKRKGVYLGPSWDDGAGKLPTFSTVDDMDFDALLSQMQTQQSSKQDSVPKRKKKESSPSETLPELAAPLTKS